MREDWAAEPHRGGEAAFIEMVALAINSEQPLYEKQRVIDLLIELGNQEAIEHYYNLRRDLSAYYPALTRDWGVYCVRRMFLLPDPGEKAPAPFRQTTLLFRGTEQAALEHLHELADRYGKQPELIELSYRFWTIERPEPIQVGKSKRKQPPPRPYVEEQFVCCPATVVEKQRIDQERYDLKWLGVTGNFPFIKGVNDHEQEIQKSRVRVSILRGKIQ